MGTESKKDYLPVEWVRGNLLFSPQPPGKFARRRCWAGYELTGPHYEFVPGDRALALHDDLTALLRALADVPECHLMMVPEPVRAAETQQALLQVLNDDGAKKYCQAVADAIGELDHRDAVCRYRFCLWLRLPAPPHVYGNLREWGAAALSDWRGAVESLAGIGGPEIPERHLQAWAQAEEAMRSRLDGIGAASSLQFRPLATWESLLRLRAPLWRGIGQPALSKDWAPQAAITANKKGEILIRPDAAATRRLFSGRVDHLGDDGYLRVTQTVDGRPRSAYQAFLTVEQFAHNPLPVIGGEWAYLLQQEASPVELHLHWTSRDYQATLDDLSSQRRKQDDTSEQEQEHEGGMSSETARSQSETEDMESYIRETRSPLCLTSIVVCLTGATPEILTERIRAARLVFDRLDIKVAQNGTDQYRHFVETIPGAERQVSDYVHRLLPPALATCMIGATGRLMDPVGTYIGVDDRGRPLWYLPWRALAVLDTSGSAVAVGPMGKGKSLSMNFFAYLCVLLGDARLLAIDSAKPERSLWPQRLPLLGPYTRVVTLSASEADRGKLDPYTIFADRREATNHAISQAAFLTQTKLDQVGYDVLLRAFAEVRDFSDRPCMMAGIQVLEQLGRDGSYKYHEVAERLAERLRNIGSLAYASLLFGTGQSAGVDISSRITVLQLDRIQRPPEGKAVEDYTLDEYVSHACMVATVALANAFARSDRRRQKVVLADEIRWFVNSSYGRDLIEQQTLVGRAMGTQVFLVGQNVSHIPEDLLQHFTTRYAFGAATEAEAIATLEFLGAEATRENIDRLMALNPGDVKGQCLIRDLAGNIGQAQISLLFPELLDAFNTKSLNHDEGARDQVAATGPAR